MRAAASLLLSRVAAAMMLAIVLALLCRAFGQAQGLVGNNSSPDAFTQGALNTVLGDLQQEIVAGSIITTVTNGSTVPIYFPNGSAIVPSRTDISAPANLLKRSAYNQPFYSGSNYTMVGSPAPNRAASLSTTGASLNGRLVSLARWNKPILLPKANSLSATDLTPITTGSNPFVAPDWILVARDSSNPIAWNPNMQTSNTNSTSVVGRYAYTIYDEGGLLDMTVAGYPSGTATQQTAYKQSLAAADLTQLKDASSNPLLTQAQIDAIVNWRSTHTFTGRQDLINLLTQTITTGGSSAAVLQQALQYLGTFSRDVNQPSFAPNPGRPAIAAVNGGGNNQYRVAPALLNPSFLTVRVQQAFVRNDGSQAAVNDPLVSKRFDLNRIAWLTYKGPIADDNGNLNPTGDANIAAMITSLESTYGLSAAFLSQGGPTNILNCFGLTWQADSPANRTPGDGQMKWFYNHGGVAAGASAIMVPNDVAAKASPPREADFFELLKAAITGGSKGKASTDPGFAPSAIHPYNVQSTSYDIDLNLAIIQIGANIIDQFDLDNYATRIVYEDGSGLTRKEVRGVENLPYLYRVRNGTLKLRDENPVWTNITSPTYNGGSTMADTGVVAVIQIPEVWNPHDGNSNAGLFGPAHFRVVANSIEPYRINLTSHTGYNFLGMTGEDTQSLNTNVGPNNLTVEQFTGISNFNQFTLQANSAISGGTPISRGFHPVVSQSLYEDANGGNNAISFDVPNSNLTLFRNPTLLARYHVPSGSNLHIDWPIANDHDLTKIQNKNGQTAWDGNGFRSESSISNPLALPSASGSNAEYLGIVIGLYPAQFACQNNAIRPPSHPASSYDIFHCSLCVPCQTMVNPYLTYRMEYQDPLGNWVVYDEKYTLLSTTFLGTPFGNGGYTYSHAATTSLIQDDANWVSFMDPRTARFSTIQGEFLFNNAAPPGQNAQDWLDGSNDVLVSNRPDVESGFGFACGRYALGPSTFGVPDWNGLYKAKGWHADGMYFRPGLYAQNSVSVADDGMRFSGDTSHFGTAPNPPTFYTDPDGVVRRAAQGYVLSGSNAATTDTGSPQANTSYTANSRPILLNRPFRSVGELGYAFSGTPWKNLDFFTPESGDAALLDVFCVNDISNSTGLISGKLNVNTRQAPVLQTLLAGAYKDEESSYASPPATALSSITATESQAVAIALVARTSSGVTVSTSPNSPNIGNGALPLSNLGELVGKWVTSITTPNGTAPHNIDGSKSYDGFSNDLTSIYGSTGSIADPVTNNIQRFREAPMRALANVSTARVWNLLIDVIAQNGEYPATAGGLGDFQVDSESRYWLHVAIDRYTNQVLDQTLEPVSEAPGNIALSTTFMPENQSVGTTVSALSSVDLDSGIPVTYALVSGSGSSDNSSFTITGGSLLTNAIFNYLTKSSYNIRLQVTDANGLTYQQAFTIAVVPSPYTQWKITNFNGNANSASVAGDNADPDHDGLVNLMEYALGTSPLSANGSGVTMQSDGAFLRLGYTKLTSSTDITLHPFWTNDLANPNSWSNTGVTETLLSDDGTLQHWQASVPIHSARQMFMRLQAANAVSGQSSPYSQWKSAKFGSNVNDFTIAGDTADPDHDGMPNLLEYALGTSPASSDGSGITSQTNGTIFTLSYTKLSLATDISLHAYWTNDPANPNSWSRTGVSETMLLDDGILQHWQAAVPLGSSSQFFMRLKVTKP